MRRRRTIQIVALGAVFVATTAVSTMLLSQLRARAVAEAQREASTIERRRIARSDFACVWGRDLDRDRLEDASRTAAQAVGLNVVSFDVRAAAGTTASRSRTLTLTMEATGGFDVVIGFLRLGVFEKPALAIESLKLTSAGGQAVTMLLIAKAECGY